ncbi:MAG: 6-carboxytetrahydropterin synthase [Arenicellales bacterium]
MIERAYTIATAGFEAACKIDSLPSTHRASRLHGHSFQVKVRAALPDGWAQFDGSEVDDLSEHLSVITSELDHRYLNKIIPNPSNENIARWLQDKLSIKADKIAIQSTPYEGVDLDAKGNAHVWQQFSFEAAHQLPNVEAGHQCGRMHGHGFKVILHAHQALGDAPMAVDLDELTLLWQSVSSELEYSCLNDIKGLENPTSEHLCAWLWRRLRPQMDALSFVSVYETATAGCHFDGQNFRIWKDFRFESAVRFTRAPAKDARRKMHGHSYLARLHLQAPLDKVFGWTIDYGDVSTRFKPILNQLDHYALDEVSGLETPSSAQIVAWIRAQLGEALPELDRVDCFERSGCGAVLSWADEGPALPI